MVGKFSTILLLSLACSAQDFEPDRRPEEGLFAAVDYTTGVPRLVGEKQSGLTVIQTVSSSVGGQRYPRAAFFRTFNSGSWLAWDSRFAASTFSVSVWVCDNVTGAGNRRLVQLGSWVGSTETGNFLLYNDSAFACWGFAHKRNGSTTQYNGFAGYTPIRPGVFEHFAYVKTPTTISVYANGVLVESSVGTWTNDATTPRLGLGFGWNNTTTQYDSARGAGMLDFRYYTDRALTASEVRSLYESGVSP